MKNNTIVELCQKLKASQNILIFPHVNMDGDALGSATALCKALRMLDKNAYVLLEDEIPENIKFLDKGYCTHDKNIMEKPDLCVCVDCGLVDRFPLREKAFFSGKETMCIDHHSTTNPIFDYNYIDGNSPATGQIMFLVIKELGITGDVEIGEAIFAAITTDTGNFQYANTNKESHLIAAQLMEWGIDTNKVSVAIYQNERLERLLIENRVINTLSTVSGGRIAMAYVTQEMLKETGADMSETDECVAILRNIRGVCLSAFLKEIDDNTVKVSLRAKREGDVAAIAAKYHGGGHTKAAGFTIHDNLSNAFEIVKRELLESLKEIN